MNPVKAIEIVFIRGEQAEQAEQADYCIHYKLQFELI